ncbi:MAG: ABC transporter substrate-binding protein, partial [Pseudomonadota bacterium]
MKKWLPAVRVIAVVVLGVIVATQFMKSEPKTKVVAIATLMSHPALDAVQENLKKELERHGLVEGKNIRYVIRNANGQVQLAANIATELASQAPDVIVAVTTPMAQAVAKTARCPVVFAAVTDPVGAGLVKSLDKGEDTITGTSDAWPYEDQLKLIRQISPNAKRLGVLYNPGEAASQYGIKEIRRFAPGLGFELVEGSVSSTGEVYPVAQNLAGRVDALFLSSDNTVIGGVAAAVKVAVEHKIPLYVGDSGTVEKGGLAAVSVGYSGLGTETGKLVVRLLNGERSIPTVVARGAEVYINKKAAQMMGVTVPEEVL